MTTKDTARSPTALKEALSLETAAGVMDFKINEEKDLILKLYRILHIWALFWVLTMIILLKSEKEFYWLTSAFMD